MWPWEQTAEDVRGKLRAAGEPLPPRGKRKASQNHQLQPQLQPQLAIEVNSSAHARTRLPREDMMMSALENVKPCVMPSMMYEQAIFATNTAAGSQTKQGAYEWRPIFAAVETPVGDKPSNALRRQTTSVGFSPLYYSSETKSSPWRKVQSEEFCPTPRVADPELETVACRVAV